MARVHTDLRFADIPKRTSTLRVPTTAGDVTCTVYRPTAVATAPAPVYVNFHGGGFVIRRATQDDHICRYLAAHAHCVVINVDYAVAPQKSFPTASTQAYEVVEWVALNGGAEGWDGSRAAVGGQSAGGNLAAGVCLTARDRGSFAPRLQILNYPPLDLVTSPEAKRARTEKPLITPGLSRIFNDAYAPDPATRRDPLVSPVLAADLTGLAPALVITAEYDTLRDEADAYAKALEAAGVAVTHRVFQGADHAFTHAGPAASAKEAFALMATTLDAALAY
jgi:acetyl esterase